MGCAIETCCQRATVWGTNVIQLAVAADSGISLLLHKNDLLTAVQSKDVLFSLLIVRMNLTHNIVHHCLKSARKLSHSFCTFSQFLYMSSQTGPAPNKNAAVIIVNSSKLISRLIRHNRYQLYPPRRYEKELPLGCLSLWQSSARNDSTST